MQVIELLIAFKIYMAEALAASVPFMLPFAELVACSLLFIPGAVYEIHKESGWKASFTVVIFGVAIISCSIAMFFDTVIHPLTK